MTLYKISRFAFLLQTWIIRGSYNTQSRNNTKYILISNKCNCYIKELCNVTSKLLLHLKASAHFKMGTMRHYFGKFPITCGHYHISRYFSGTFENRQTSKKLASKTCKMFLENTKISKNRARELSVKGGPKNIFLWKRACPELRRDVVK